MQGNSSLNRIISEGYTVETSSILGKAIWHLI